MRIIDPEYPDTLADPEVKDALQLLPELPPLACFEIERIDVLILLGRILGILNAAVRPPAKPLRMLAGVGMIGAALKCDIERYLEAVFFGFVQESPEVL